MKISNRLDKKSIIDEFQLKRTSLRKERKRRKGVNYGQSTGIQANSREIDRVHDIILNAYNYRLGLFIMYRKQGKLAKYKNILISARSNDNDDDDDSIPKYQSRDEPLKRISKSSWIMNMVKRKRLPRIR